MKKTQINLDQWIWTAVLRLQLNQSCLSIDSFIDSMNQEHVAHINQTQHHFSTDNGMSDEAINDIRRAIEQYHSPMAYYISFGLDQPGVRSVEMNHRIKHLKLRLFLVRPVSLKEELKICPNLYKMANILQLFEFFMICLVF